MPIGSANPSTDQWSRRGFLATLSAISLGTVAGCHMPSSSTDERFGDAGSRGGPSSPSGGSGSSYAPVAPYALTAESSLSQDLFLFRTHQIDPVKDTVIAYSRADGQVEAMLLQDKSIKQVYRDPSRAGGWNVHTFPDGIGDVADMVAGMSSPTQKYSNQPKLAPTLKVFYRRTSQPDKLFIATNRAGSASDFDTVSVPWKSTGRLQLSVGFDDSVLVAAITESSSLTQADGRLDFWTDTRQNSMDTPVTTGSLTNFAYRTDGAPAGWTPGWAATVAAPWVTSTTAGVHLALPSGTYGQCYPHIPDFVSLARTLCLTSWTLDTANPAAEKLTPLVQLPPHVPTDVNAYRIESMTAYGSLNLPTVVLRTIGDSYQSGEKSTVQRLWLLSPNDAEGSTSWEFNPLDLPAPLAANRDMVVSTATRPLPDTEKIGDPGQTASAARRFLDVFVLADDTVHVFRQAPQGDAVLDYYAPAYCPVIALHPGVAHMTSQPALSSGDELLLVGSDGMLVSLEKDPTTGIWADRPVHLPADDLEETAAYRVSIGVVDFWQIPVAGQPLKITASSSVAALINGAAVVLGADPVTVKSDDQGLIDLALVADGLSAPSLTVTGDGGLSGTIDPSAPVNAYFQGGSPLNYLDPLDEGTLAGAKAPDGSPVAPGAAESSSDAHDAVTSMALAAKQASAPDSLSARRSATPRRRDGQPTGTSRAELTGIKHKIDKWFHDAVHAIKTGAVKVEHIAYDAASKTFTIGADFVNWADHELTIVVKGVEDAAHVIQAFLNKLGGEIVHAIKWLAAEVIGTFKDAVALADQYNSWIGSTCTFLHDQTANQKATIDHWLATEKDAARNALVDLAGRYAPGTTLATIGSQGPSGTKPSRLTGAQQRALGRAVGADGDSGDDASGDGAHKHWLWHKIKNELLGGDLKLPAVSGVERAVQQLATAGEQALSDFEDAFKDFLTFLETVITRPDKAATLGLRELLLALSKLVDAAFLLAQAFVDTMFDLLLALSTAVSGILENTVDSNPVVRALFDLVGLGKVTYGQLICTLFAFPAVVAYKVGHRGRGRPFQSATLGDPRAGGDDGLTLSATAAIFFWTDFDLVSAAIVATKGEPSTFFALVDIAAPIIVGFLTVPGTKDGPQYLTPPVSGEPGAEENFYSWLLTLVPAFLTAANLYLDHSGQGDKKTEGSFLFGTSMAGMLSLVLGCIGLGESHGSAAEYADLILNSLPNISIPGVGKEMAEATELISVGVTIACIAVGGYAGAAVHAIA